MQTLSKTDQARGKRRVERAPYKNSPIELNQTEAKYILSEDEILAILQKEAAAKIGFEGFDGKLIYDTWSNSIKFIVPLT